MTKAVDSFNRDQDTESTATNGNTRLIGGTLLHGGKTMVGVFKRSGVNYVFCSPGTEWPPVWEAFAEAEERGDTSILYINCRHEALAVAMASGYTKVRCKPWRYLKVPQKEFEKLQPESLAEVAVLGAK